ncbi:MAG: hypothetical protein KDA65_04270 [Planctomycetaceae bacterium]|nr:hypothetical protein [Planctomycetaceae bacterium]
MLTVMIVAANVIVRSSENGCRPCLTDAFICRVSSSAEFFYGTGSQYKLHRVIRKFITTVPEGRRAGSHGNCAELDAISRLLFEYEATYNRRFRTIEEAREFLKGARIQIRDIHLGERKPPCTTCRPTLEALGIEHKDPP